jgi:hypothetical protein
MNNIKILLQNTGMTTTNYKKGCDDCIVFALVYETLFENTYWLKHDITILYTGLYDIVIKNFREKFSTAKNGVS